MISNDLQKESGVISEVVLYCRFGTQEILMTQGTVRIVALILLVVVIAIIFLRRKGKKKTEDDF